MSLKTYNYSPFQLAIVAIIFNIFRTVKVDNLLGKLLEQPGIYADFEFLAFWQTQYNNMNAVNLFFAWIKVKKHLSPKHIKLRNGGA